MKEVQGNFPKGICNPVDQVKLLLWKKKIMFNKEVRLGERFTRGWSYQERLTVGQDIFWVLRDCPALGGWRENVQGRRTNVRMVLEVGMGIALAQGMGKTCYCPPATARGKRQQLLLVSNVSWSLRAGLLLSSAEPGQCWPWLCGTW